MRRQAVILLIFALTAGGLAALLATRVLRTPPSFAQPVDDAGAVGVVVAARDMNVGTFLTRDDVRMVRWPAGDLPAGYSLSADEVVGRGLLSPVRLNEPLLTTKLARPESGGGMHIMIPEGKRAVSVRVDDVVGVAGFVLPGSRVDVVVTMDRATQLAEPATRVVLQNLEVISAGQSIERSTGGEPQQVPVVTLIVGPEEAELLALAHSNGRLQLALRNPLDLDSVGTPGITASHLIAGRPPPRVAQAAPRPAAPAPAAPRSLQLEVFRGQERSTATVDTTLERGGGQ